MASSEDPRSNMPLRVPHTQASTLEETWYLPYEDQALRERQSLTWAVNYCNPLHGLL